MSVQAYEIHVGIDSKADLEMKGVDSHDYDPELDQPQFPVYLYTRVPMVPKIILLLTGPICFLLGLWVYAHDSAADRSKGSAGSGITIMVMGVVWELLVLNSWAGCYEFLEDRLVVHFGWLGTFRKGLRWTFYGREFTGEIDSFPDAIEQPVFVLPCGVGLKNVGYLLARRHESCSALFTPIDHEQFQHCLNSIIPLNSLSV